MTRPVIFALLLAAGISTVSFAQSKEEEKEWKAKLKSLTPMQYKELVDQNEALQSQVNDAANTVDQYKSESEAKDAELAKLREELAQAKEQAIAAQKVPEPEPAAVTTASTANSVKSVSPGLVYKVQIGAFRKKNLEKYLNNHKNFSGDVDQDGTRKYTLGEFSDYWEADRFKKYLREMGVKDAWLVAYKNGQRIPIKDALEGVL